MLNIGMTKQELRDAVLSGLVERGAITQLQAVAFSSLAITFNPVIDNGPDENLHFAPDLCLTLGVTPTPCDVGRNRTGEL